MEEAMRLFGAVSLSIGILIGLGGTLFCIFYDIPQPACFVTLIGGALLFLRGVTLRKLDKTIKGS